MYRGFVLAGGHPRAPRQRAAGLHRPGSSSPRRDAADLRGTRLSPLRVPDGDDERSVRRSPRFGRRLPAQNYPRRAERRLGDIRDRRARTSLDFDISQQFRCRRVIVGAHVDGHQVYAATRFRLVKGSLPLPDGEATTADGSLLRILPVNQRGEKQWFEFEPKQPATLNHFDMQVMNPVITLFSLVTGNETDHRDPQVRLDADSPWMPLYEGMREVKRDGLNLLATNHLTPRRFAHWIDLRKTLEALDAAALDEMHGVTIQTQVLAQVAVAEGLHRRLYTDNASTRRVPKLSSTQRKKVRHAAREAAVATLTGDQFTDHDRASSAMLSVTR